MPIYISLTVKKHSNAYDIKQGENTNPLDKEDVIPQPPY